MSPHIAVVVAGLGDQVKLLEYLTRGWSRHGVTPVVVSIGWRDRTTSWDEKFGRLLGTIRTYGATARVSLVGTSAGGSAVVNAYAAMPRGVWRVVNVCGRLRVGPTGGWRSFAAKTATSPAFAESVRVCDESLRRMALSRRRNILTIRAGLGDELVPPQTVPVDGGTNLTVPVAEHMLGIAAALTVYRGRIFRFLSTQE